MAELNLEESNVLLYAVADSCNPQHPLFNDRVAIASTIGAELAIIRLVQHYDPLSAAKMSFGLGVYLGLQYQQLKNLAR